MPASTAMAGIPIFSTAEGDTRTGMATWPIPAPLVMAGPAVPTAAMIPSSGSTAVGGSFSPPCSLPEKLIKRILDLEFIDMSELIPDNRRFNAGTDEGMCCHHSRKQRRGPVVDILLWVECYSTLVSVLSSKFPLKTPDLMAYQRTIVYAHRSFAGDGWVTYDLSYRRRAALRKSLDWGQVDFNLYNESFAGRARVISRCKHCSSEHHGSHECEFAPDRGEQGSWPTKGKSPRARFDATRSSLEPCHLFNHKEGNRFRFQPCRFAHTCTDC